MSDFCEDRDCLIIVQQQNRQNHWDTPRMTQGQLNQVKLQCFIKEFLQQQLKYKGIPAAAIIISITTVNLKASSKQHKPKYYYLGII
jgi:hypothetical protein